MGEGHALTAYFAESVSCWYTHTHSLHYGDTVLFTVPGTRTGYLFTLIYNQSYTVL